MRGLYYEEARRRERGMRCDWDISSCVRENDDAGGKLQVRRRQCPWPGREQGRGSERINRQRDGCNYGAGDIWWGRENSEHRTKGSRPRQSKKSKKECREGCSTDSVWTTRRCTDRQLRTRAQARKAACQLRHSRGEHANALEDRFLRRRVLLPIARSVCSVNTSARLLTLAYSDPA